MTEQFPHFGPIMEQASSLLRASRSLDYPAILRHEPASVARLREVIARLGLSANGSAVKTRRSTLTSVNTDTTVLRVAADQAKSKPVATNRLQELVQRLGEEGFSERLAHIYDSQSVSRSIAFKQAPHRYGLPGFDMVVAPDFSPVQGLHGIFITALEVFTAVLPSPASEHEWKILKRREYQGIDQLLEYVTLLSAGFDLD